MGNSHSQPEPGKSIYEEGTGKQNGEWKYCGTIPTNFRWFHVERLKDHEYLFIPLSNPSESS